MGGSHFPDLGAVARSYENGFEAALKEQGTTPDIVSIGNEITYGMLWPDGQVGDGVDRIRNFENYDNLATLLKSGITAVKEVDPSIKIMLHHHLGRREIHEFALGWLDNLLARDVQFDIIGMSCYAQAKEGDWKQNFDDLAMRYPHHDLVIAEYSARKEYLNELIYNAPNKMGLGTFIWEPTRHREALFDQNGNNAGGGQASNFVTTEGISQRRQVFATTPHTSRDLSAHRTHGRR